MRRARVTTAQAVRAALLVLLLVAGVVLAVTVDLPSVATLRGWLADAGAWGWVGLVVVSALVTLAPVPRTALSVLAGVLAGFEGGLVVAWASGVLGAAAGFGVARLLGRDTVQRLAGPRLARADAVLTHRGVLSTLLGRLTPVAPFTLVSYAGGLSGIRFRDHLLGTAIGLVPGTVLHVGVGATVGAAGELGGWTLLASALPFAVVGTVLVVRWLRRRRLTRSAAV
ncbi:TVP38/TMEM64 family protein [Geodermatophilaceae bacterium NBWT11]|nr:TVP38/TMEM64 family protein [Geodermatophilaceae bacterium NBWT11]